jgi:hypothetical protein
VPPGNDVIFYQPVELLTHAPIVNRVRVTAAVTDQTLR